MYWTEIKRIAAIAGFLTGMFCLFINILMKRTLLESALLAFFVVIISSFIYLACLQAVGRILANFLVEQQKAATELENKRKREEEEAQKLQQEEDQRVATAKLEQAKKEKIAEMAAKQNAENQAE